MNFGGTIRINRTGILILIILSVILLLYNLRIETIGFGVRNEKYLENRNLIDLKDLLLGLLEATKLGGQQVLQALNNPNTQIKGKTKEGVDEPVTKADLNSHCVMFYGLKQLFPQIKVISEEEGSDSKRNECNSIVNDNQILLPKNKKITLNGIELTSQQIEAPRITVWIDPLDATQEFTENLTDFVTTMACVAVDGQPLIGVVHNPFKNATSWAWVGRISSPDLHKEMNKSNKKPKIIISRSHSGDTKAELVKVFPDAEIVTAGGAGYKMLQVAHGEATAYIHKTFIKKWDLCAGNAIIKFLAGGEMTTFNGLPINYSNAEKSGNDKGVVATLANHDYYLQQVQKIPNKS